MAYDAALARRAARRLEDEQAEAGLTPTFPVPPMDLVVPTPPATRRACRPSGPRHPESAHTDA